MPKKLKTVFQYSFFLGLGIFLVWWSLRDLTITDQKEIAIALKRANYGYILPGISILLLSHWVRALRWRILMEPLGYSPSKLNTFFAIMVGYLANQAVPRLGEVLRCSTLTRYEKIPFDKLLGTVIVERIVDAISLLILFGIALITQTQLYDSILDTFFLTPSNNHGSKFRPVLLGILVVTILLALWVITKKKQSRIIVATKKILLHIWQGFTAIKSLKRPWTFIFLTIVLWVLYAFCVYTGFLMLKETQIFGWKEAITVLCAGSLGMIATPGGIGAYAFLVQKTMILYHLNNGIGLALGWILWLLQTGAILIVGGISMISLPLYNKRK